MSKQSDQAGSRRLVSRRGLVAGAGVGAAAALTGGLTLGGNAFADDDLDSTGNPRSEAQSGGARPESFPSTPGLSYQNYGPWSFFTNSNGDRQLSGGIVSSPAGFIVCPIDLPAGTRIRELTVWGANNSGGVRTVNLEGGAVDGPSTPPLMSVALPNGAIKSTAYTVTGDAPLPAGQWHILAMLSGSIGVGLWAVRLGYSAATAFVPIVPYRAYDSRKAGVPSPGVLAPNSSRVVNVLNSIDDAGAVLTAGVIPASARAVAYNLTATGTTGDNYLSIAPGTAASTTVSSINFSTGQTLANAAIVSLDSGTVKVFCGDNMGSSHFLIDITGYYL